MMKANPNYTYLKEEVPKKRVTLLQGSTRSGKTFAACYYIIYLCLNHKGLEIDIVRDTYTALKATVWKDFKSILLEHKLYNVEFHNKTDHQYLLNGNLISYYGADNGDKIHGRSRDILFINEGQHLEKETADQLFPRTRQRIIVDYNPALGLDHWLDKYIDQFPPLITTYKDNPFLTKAQIEDIESRKDDNYWWSVYGEGLRAAREGAIFTNWTIGDFDNTLYNYGYGQDFGFSTDPTTLIKVAIDEDIKTIYVDEEYVEQGLTTEEIYTLNEKAIEMPNDLIVADSAEPRLIYEVKNLGLNIIPVKKGKGSVLFGIMLMQKYKIVVTSTSKNVISELSKYVWNNKKAGVPVDKDNHTIDAIRYIVTKLTSQSTIGIMTGEKFYI